MIDCKYNDCKVICKLSNAYRRDEENNCVIYIPEGKDIRDPLFINEQGEIVLQLAKKRKTVIEIIDTMQKKYPEVGPDLIAIDIYKFLQNAIATNILRIEGFENMYNGENIGLVGGYSYLQTRMSYYE